MRAAVTVQRLDAATRVRVLSALAAGRTREQVAADERVAFGCVLQIAAAAGWPSRPRMAAAAAQQVTAAGVVPARPELVLDKGSRGKSRGPKRMSLGRLVDAAMASRHPATHAAARDAVLAVHRLARVIAADPTAGDPTPPRATRVRTTKAA